VNDTRSLDDILASISGDRTSAEIFEALKSVAKTQPAPEGSSTGGVHAPGQEQFMCPVCEARVDARAKTCPSCGAQFEEGEEAEFECPVCRTTVSADSNRCPGCGVLFAEEEPAEPVIASRERAEAHPAMPSRPPSPAPTITFGAGLGERLASVRRSRREAPMPTPSGDRKLMYRELPKYVNDVRGLLVSAKRMGVEIEKEKRTINEAIAAGKRREVERALANIAEAKHALDVALTEHLARRIEAIVAQVGRVGAPERANDLEGVLREAVNRIEARNYDGAFEQVEHADKAFQTQAHDYVEANESLDQEDRILADAKSLGMDVGEVETLLQEGRAAMSRRDQQGAMNAAQEARARLAKALPAFVDGEMRRARNQLLDLKVRGGDLSKPIGILKAASVHAKREDWGSAIRYLREFRKEVDSLR
jgi:hypothetical protein